MGKVRDWWIQGAWWASGIFATGAIWYFLSVREYKAAWIAVLGAIGFALLAVFLHRRKDKLSLSPDVASFDAANRFRSSFAEATTQLGHVDAYSRMHRLKVQHDVAIFEFHRHVPGSRQAAFDAAARTFQECRDAVSPAAVEAMRAIATEEPR